MTTTRDVLYAWGFADATKHVALESGRSEAEAIHAGLQTLIENLNIPLTDHKPTRNTTHLRSIK